MTDPPSQEDALPTLILDLNHVIVDLERVKVDIAREITGQSILPEYLQNRLAVKRALMTDAQYDEMNRRLFDLPDGARIREAVPMEGMPHYLPKLLEIWKIYIVSAIDELAFERLTRLLRHWSNFYPEIGRATRRHRGRLQFFGVGRRGNKNQFGKALAAADDELRNLLALAPSARFLVLFDRYNTYRRGVVVRAISGLSFPLRVLRARVPSTKKPSTRPILIVRSWNQLFHVLGLIAADPAHLETLINE